MKAPRDYVTQVLLDARGQVDKPAFMAWARGPRRRVRAAMRRLGTEEQRFLDTFLREIAEQVSGRDLAWTLIEALGYLLLLMVQVHKRDMDS